MPENKKTSEYRFIEDIGTSFLCELSRALNFELVRTLRDDENAAEVLKKDAEWLKQMLPRYIDMEVDTLLSVLGEE